MKNNNNNKITRKEALKKIGNYGKYTALTALGTYLLLHPKKAQATSPLDAPGPNFDSYNENIFEDLFDNNHYNDDGLDF